MPDGLTCGHTHARFHGQNGGEDDAGNRRDSPTKNTTDLRRSRQHARAVMRDIERDIQEYLEQQNIEQYGRGDLPEQRLNERISRLAATKLSNDLVRWLEQRRKQTMARAVRAAMQAIQTALQQTASFDPDELDLSGFRDNDAELQHLNRVISQIDAGLLYDDDDSLAEEIGNDVTRQIRLGVANDEGTREIGDRVHEVLNDGDSPTRERHGVTGQTKKTKAELIAHDSVQQGYQAATTERYLRNGFRYVRYDAVLDTKTSTICRRLDGELIDLTKTPWLVPGNHPWCRSGIRPALNPDDDPITEGDISDDYLQTVFSTEQYRPTVMDAEAQLQPTALTEAAQGGA